MSSQKTYQPSGTSPLGGISPSWQTTNLSRAPAAPTPEELHESEKKRLLGERKIARLEADLTQANKRFKQEEELFKQWEEELKQRFEQSEKELQQKLKQSKEKIDALEVECEMHARAIDTKDEFIQSLQLALDQTDRPRIAEDPDYVKALMNEFQNVIAVCEDHTNYHMEKGEFLGSVADDLASYVKTAKYRADYLARNAEKAVSSGSPDATNVSAQAKIRAHDAQRLVAMLDKLVRIVKEDNGSNAKVKKACAAARRKFGNSMTRLGPNNRDAETETSDGHSTDLTETEVPGGVTLTEGKPTGEVTVGRTQGGTTAGSAPGGEEKTTSTKTEVTTHGSTPGGNTTPASAPRGDATTWEKIAKATTHGVTPSGNTTVSGNTAVAITPRGGATTGSTRAEGTSHGNSSSGNTAAANTPRGGATASSTAQRGTTTRRGATHGSIPGGNTAAGGPLGEAATYRGRYRGGNADRARQRGGRGRQYHNLPNIIRTREAASQARANCIAAEERKKQSSATDDQGFTLTAKSKSAPANRGPEQASVITQAAKQPAASLDPTANTFVPSSSKSTAQVAALDPPKRTLDPADKKYAGFLLHMRNEEEEQLRIRSKVPDSKRLADALLAYPEEMRTGEITVGGTTHGRTTVGSEPGGEATTMGDALVHQKKNKSESLTELKKSRDPARREFDTRSSPKPAKSSRSPAECLEHYTQTQYNDLKEIKADLLKEKQDVSNAPGETEDDVERLTKQLQSCHCLNSRSSRKRSHDQVAGQEEESSSAYVSGQSRAKRPR